MKLNKKFRSSNSDFLQKLFFQILKNSLKYTRGEIILKYSIRINKYKGFYYLKILLSAPKFEIYPMFSNFLRS